MYSEITHEAFKALVSDGTQASYAEHLEHAHKVYYKVYGIVCVLVTNYLSGVVQCYVQDINS